VQKNYIKQETLERLKVDEEVLGEFFRDIISPAKVDKRLQALAEIRELASAESVDAFTLAYTNLLQNHPDCPVCVQIILVFCFPSNLLVGLIPHLAIC
jgi:exocyst complex component 3